MKGRHVDVSDMWVQTSNKAEGSPQRTDPLWRWKKKCWPIAVFRRPGTYNVGGRAAARVSIPCTEEA